MCSDAALDALVRRVTQWSAAYGAVDHGLLPTALQHRPKDPHRHTQAVHTPDVSLNGLIVRPRWQISNTCSCCCGGPG